MYGNPARLEYPTDDHHEIAYVAIPAPALRACWVKNSRAFFHQVLAIRK